MKNKTRENAKRNISRQPNVYSYYSSRKEQTITKPRSSLRQKLSKRANIFKVFLIVGILIVIGYILSIDSPVIVRTSSGSKPTREISVYRARADEYVKSSILNRNKITFDYSNFSSEMKETFPELKTASISFDALARKPIVKLSFYEPVFQSVSRGTTWIIDSRGVAVSKASDSSSNTAGLLNIDDRIGLISKSGDRLLSDADSRFLSEVANILKEKGIVVKKATIPLVPKETDILLENENFTYKLNSDLAAREQVGSLLAARETLASRGEIPTEYVDLRSGEKVFWR